MNRIDILSSPTLRGFRLTTPHAYVKKMISTHDAFVKLRAGYWVFHAPHPMSCKESNGYTVASLEKKRIDCLATITRITPFVKTSKLSSPENKKVS
jgi:hypothetical protein